MKTLTRRSRTRSLCHRWHGNLTKATEERHSTRFIGKRRSRNGSLKYSILNDLSLKEQYALIFFSKCQFPLHFQKSSKSLSTLESKSITTKDLTRQILGNFRKIASLARFYLMILSLSQESQRNFIPVLQKLRSSSNQ